MKTLNIEIPSGYEIDLEQSNLSEGKVVFKEAKKQLPKTWKEFGKIKGYYVNAFSHPISFESNASDENRNVFPTSELAEASIAMAQLSQLREVYRQGWKPNWEDAMQKKFSLRFDSDRLVKGEQYTVAKFLIFQSEEIRDEFLNNFASLIETAKPLMS